MVISETIICRRFIQNAWKKDLCSNCFKSKEDHAIIAEKRITYRWTSHVNNFPQHGILKDPQKNEKKTTRAVSFQTEESEIIGFGGEEYSSDDDDYPMMLNDNSTGETDNDEDDKEFRKLTKSNTDFNSVAANLKNEAKSSTNGNAPIRNINTTYSDLKFGLPLVDAEGRRQTLQVSVEPFRNSVTVCGDSIRSSDEAPHTASKMIVNNYLRNDKTDKMKEQKDSKNRNCESNVNHLDDGCNETVNYNRQRVSNIEGACEEVHDEKATTVNISDNFHKHIDDIVTGCDNNNIITSDSVSILNVSLKDGFFENETNLVVRNAVDDGVEESKYTKVSNVVVDGPKIAIVKSSVSQTESTTTTNLPSDRSKILPYCSFTDGDLVEKEKRACSMSKDCNPITNLPPMVCKALDIEFDSPCSREMVGEPDGKADSDDSYDPQPLSSSATLKVGAPIDSSIYVNPQRSFLHEFSESKPKTPNIKPETDEMPRKSTTVCSPEPLETSTVNDLPCTPKGQIPITCNGTGSVKRQAPKPPSPKIISNTPLFTAPVELDVIKTTADSHTANDSYEHLINKCESPLVSGHRDAISFLGGDQTMNNIRRKLNLDPVVQPNRNSLNVCVSVTPNGSDSLKRFSALTDAKENSSNGKDCESSICSLDRRYPPKCSRSLSCDSIISPNAVNVLPEKTRKYSGATIRVKSKIRKLLRFNNKDEEKVDHDNSALAAPRKRIEIIHPLDLNTSTIEILGSNFSHIVNGDSDIDKKKSEIENATASRICPNASAVYATCPGGRPTKPPPPPRSQSLDQNFSEISRPVRPPPPITGNLKPFQSPLSSDTKLTPNLYENIGQSRNGIAPAKPQRAASIRERTRQITSITSLEESFASLGSDNNAVPECDQNLTHLSNISDSPPVSSINYCGSETESDIYDSSNGIKDNLIICTSTIQVHKSKGVMHKSLEDNYEAVVIANHEALTQLSERVNQATLIPASLKMLQTTLHIRFEHLSIDEGSEILVADWHFFNAVWNDQKVVVSVSARHPGSLRQLPLSITLYSLVKFNDMIPSRILDLDTAVEHKTNAYITIWNEEHIESIRGYYSNLNAYSGNDCGLLLTQLTNALMHLQTCGVDRISLDEVFICRRESSGEPKLLLLPFNFDMASSSKIVDDRNRMTLYECLSIITDLLLPNQLITVIISRILAREPATNVLMQIKGVSEYWLWGPCGTAFTGDRMTSLQRWLDLERATYLHQIICKPLYELSQYETCRMMFLVGTNAKILTEASFLFEKYT